MSKQIEQPKEQQVTFEQYIASLRNNVILSYDAAKETALRSVDNIAQKLAEQLQLTQALKTASKENTVQPKKVKNSERNVKKLE